MAERNPTKTNSPSSFFDSIFSGFPDKMEDKESRKKLFLREDEGVYAFEFFLDKCKTLYNYNENNKEFLKKNLPTLQTQESIKNFRLNEPKLRKEFFLKANASNLKPNISELRKKFDELIENYSDTNNWKGSKDYDGIESPTIYQFAFFLTESRMEKLRDEEEEKRNIKTSSFQNSNTLPSTSLDLLSIVQGKYGEVSNFVQDKYGEVSNFVEDKYGKVSELVINLAPQNAPKSESESKSKSESESESESKSKSKSESKSESEIKSDTNSQSSDASSQKPNQDRPTANPENADCSAVLKSVRSVFSNVYSFFQKITQSQQVNQNPASQKDDEKVPNTIVRAETHNKTPRGR